MLPQISQAYKSDASINCNCKIFDMATARQSQNEIFLAKCRNDYFPENKSYQAYHHSFLGRKEKISLRRNQYRKVKQNMAVLNMVWQQELLDKTWAKTDIMTRADSQMFKTISQYPAQNQISCFSSYVFKEINVNENQGSFGRFIQFDRNKERKNQKQNARSRCKSIPQMNCQNTPGITDRSRKQIFNGPKCKYNIQFELDRNAKSEAGEEVIKIHTFYSQKYLKNQLAETNQNQRYSSSIIFNVKNVKDHKKTHLLESLKFKDTESIKDEESSLFSQVISEQSEAKSDKGQFSVIMAAKPFWRRNTAMPKLSKFK